jgi:hypothetical protein
MAVGAGIVFVLVVVLVLEKPGSITRTSPTTRTMARL